MAGHLQISKTVFNVKHWHTNDCRRGILIESEAFPGAVKYVIKGDSIILLGALSERNFKLVAAIIHKGVDIIGCFM